MIKEYSNYVHRQEIQSEHLQNRILELKESFEREKGEREDLLMQKTTLEEKGKHQQLQIERLEHAVDITLDHKKLQSKVINDISEFASFTSHWNEATVSLAEKITELNELIRAR